MRPITLFTGQWADLPLEVLLSKVKKFGYDGVELACWGDHLEIRKADDGYCAKRLELLHQHGLQCHAISAHLVGQAICDRIDERHRLILPAHVWGDGNPDDVWRRASDEMIRCAEAAVKLGVDTVNGFTGSSIWHLAYSFPPVLPGQIEAGYELFADRWIPILNEFQKLGIRFALEVHPTEIAFDIASADRALKAIGHHPAFGFNYDPSHLAYQGVDYIGFIRRFTDRIFHVHMKDVAFADRPTEAGVFGGHVDFHDARRYWDFRSVGRGNVHFEGVIRALNDVSYSGPLSVEWEDGGMDREFGAAESCAYVRRLDFRPSDLVFDAQFSSNDAESSSTVSIL